MTWPKRLAICAIVVSGFGLIGDWLGPWFFRIGFFMLLGWTMGEIEEKYEARKAFKAFLKEKGLRL